MRWPSLFSFFVSLAVAEYSSTVAAASLPTPGSIKWSTCPESVSPLVKCGTLSVPLDYRQPHGKTISLAVAQLKSNTTNVKGSVLFNPGGPGGSGTRLIAELAEFGPSIPAYDLLQQYDLVGVDPRGVGFSTPLKCDPKLWNDRVVTAVTNEAEFNTLVNHNKAVGEACARMTGPLFDHLDTVNVAKDFELFRQALGQDKLNFVGLSYGTQIGQTYAEMYPDRVGRFVLDGMVDHSQAPASAVQTESTTYETTLGKFFEWCKFNSSCAIHGQDPEMLWNDLLNQARDMPIPAPSCQQSGPSACQTNVTYEDLLYNAQDQLVVMQAQPGVPGWQSFSDMLLEASKGNATGLASPYFDSETDLTGNWAFLAVGCQDWLHPAKAYTDVQELMYQTTAFSPLTKGFTQGFGYTTKCLGWPAPTTNPQRSLYPGIAKAPPMLFVNAFWDPETSVQWAVGVKDQIPQSNLIFRNGSGHTSYPLPGDTSKAINGWFLDGQMPTDGTVYQS